MQGIVLANQMRRDYVIEHTNAHAFYSVFGNGSARSVVEFIKFMMSAEETRAREFEDRISLARLA